MNTRLNYVSYFSIGVFVIALSGCGGGGGGGSTPAFTANSACDYAALNQPLTGQLSATDPQGRPLTYHLVSDSSQGHVQLTNPLTGAFTYTPNSNARGTDSFTFRADAGTSSSNTATFSIVYTPRIMPLGDSITSGVTNGNGTNPPVGQRVGYRKPLRDALLAGGYRIDFVGTLQSGTDAGFLPNDPEHEGHGGWSADQLVNGNTNADPGTGTGNLANWLNATQPDVVLLHIGTNDLNSSSDAAAQAQDVDNILTTIENWQQGHWPVTVLMARIIDTNPGRAATKTFNDALVNNVYPRHAAGGHVIWVDQQMLGSGDYADTLHPNDVGYQKMANVWRYPLSGNGTVTGSYSGPGVLAKCP